MTQVKSEVETFNECFSFKTYFSANVFYMFRSLSLSLSLSLTHFLVSFVMFHHWQRLWFDDGPIQRTNKQTLPKQNSLAQKRL